MKKKILLCLIGLQVTFSLYSQSKLNFYIDIAPIYSYRDYRLGAYGGVADGEYIYDSFIDRYNKEEEPILKYSINVGIEYNFSERLFFKSGLGYKEFGERVSNQAIVNQYYLNGVLIPNGTVRWDWQNTYKYLGIPLDAEYKILFYKKIKIGLLIGFDFDFLLSSEIMNPFTAQFAEMKSYLSKANSFAVDIHGGITTNISLGNKIDLLISPQYARYITPNVSYRAEFPDFGYCDINQYNCYGQLKIGIIYKW